MIRFAGRTTLVCLALVAAARLAYAQATEDQLVKYYRKKNNLGPTTKVAAQGLKDSTSIKGAKEGTLLVGDGPTAKSITFIASPDLKFVVFGDIVDTTVDPSKAVVAKMNLKDQPFSGAKDAKVVIVEYSDFQCPFCKRGYDTIEKQVLKEYGGKVKFYFKNFPLSFHPWAEPAAIATECAKMQKPDAYWKLYNAFFENQQAINPTNVKEKAQEYLKDSGVDMAKWNDCYDNKKSLEKVKAEQAEGASLGVTGTPAFFINGRMLVGAQPFEKFKDVIDDELASSK
ncbi:MAG: DsbA family protein [Candidatus Binatia bacterium]